MGIPSGETLVKITRPNLPRILRRERLLRLLDQSRGTPLVWINAPAGAGKTTLVASFLDSREPPCLWYQVDEGDADPATFFHYMGIAAAKAVPRSRLSLPLLTPEYGPGVATFARRYFERLFSKLKRPHTLVLDNYQDASESMLPKIVSSAAAVTPPGCHIIVISRAAPPADFIRLQANKKLELIGWDELRLTLEESAEIMGIQFAAALPPATIRAVHQKTGGWAAGVSLICQAIKMEALNPEAISGPLSEKAFAYFSNELFHRVEDSVQKFLLKTAIVPRLTLKTAGALSNDANADRILSQLSQRNFFIEKRRLPELTYQYHPLFREFLLHTATVTFTAKAIAALRQKAARMMETSGQVDDAAELYRESGDWRDLARLTLENAQSLLAQGRTETLERWILALPAGMVKTAPWLLYWRGVCRLARDPLQARPHFIQAYKAFDRSQDPAGLMLSWSGVIDTYMSEWDTFTPLKPWINKLRRILRRQERFPSPEIELAVAIRMLNALLNIRPQDRELKLWKQKIAEYNSQAIDPNQRIQLSAYLLLYCSYLGELNEMHAIIQDISARNLPDIEFPLPRIMWAVMTSCYCWFKADCVESLRLVENALALSQKYEFHIIDVRILVQGVFAALTAGDVDTAKYYLFKMKTIINPGQRTDVAQYYWAAALYAAVIGELDQSLESARTALAKVEETGSPFSIAMSCACLAQVHTLRGEYPEAAAPLDRARKIGRQMGSYGLSMLVYLIDAQLAHFQGDQRRMVRALRKGLAIGRKESIMGIVFWLPAVMEALCPLALAHHIETDYIQELIRRRDFRPRTPAQHLENWPWPVKIYTLGRFALFLNGSAFQFSGKAQTKPIDMLKAIIAMGGRKVSEEQLTDALWPDAEGDAGRMLLKTTLHRLRQLMRSDVKAIIRTDGRLTLDGKFCWVDVWAFERLLGEAEKICSVATHRHAKPPDRDKLLKAIRLMEKAIALYKGSFLQADDAFWTFSTREHLRMRYIRTVTAMGCHLEQSSEYGKAADCYQAALRVDDLVEEFYQHLMKCHHKLGRRTEAIRTFRRCRRALKANMDIDPSPATTALYQNIIK